MRDDRLVAVASRSRDHAGVAGLDDLPAGLIEAVEAFFAHYNRLNGKAFRPLGRGGEAAARRLVEEAARAGAGG